MNEGKLKFREFKPATGDDKHSSLEAKESWQEPKLTFIEPKLTSHGELTEVTGQFFGGFSPQ
jgi:hypothetical protein